jgi:multicomponent Na+:H+ antiporter subunit B
MRLDLILRVAAKLLIPFMLMFAIYVQLHGDYSAGGASRQAPSPRLA